MSIQITKEMYLAAVREAQKRENQGCINHHFSLEHMEDSTRNVVGFLGEFAGRVELGEDWREGIRENYYTIDQGDVITDRRIVDIKTETIPGSVFWKLIRKQQPDDAPYGRRLICEGQVDLLQKYDYVLWGAFIREKYLAWVEAGCPEGETAPVWYCLGYLDTKHILEHYSVQRETPFGRVYPIPGLPVRNSELKHVSHLRRELNSR